MIILIIIFCIFKNTHPFPLKDWSLQLDKNMRRATATCVLVGASTSLRSYTKIKGHSENRLANFYPRQTSQDSLSNLQLKMEAKANPSPKNKKEALQHLAEDHLPYEQVSDMQRVANDFMGIYNDHSEYATDMAYRYHNIWRVNNPSPVNKEAGYTQKPMKMQPGATT